MNLYRSSIVCALLVVCLFVALVILKLRSHESLANRFSERDLSKVTNAPSTPFTLDKSWRQRNRVASEYRPDIGRRVAALASAKSTAGEPEVVRLARDVIDPIPEMADVGLKRSRIVVKSPQAEKVDQLTGQKVTTVWS